MSSRRRICWLFVLLGAACAAPEPRCRVPMAEPEALLLWEFTDPAAFGWCRDELCGAGCLDLHSASSYQSPHRSPLAMALLRGAEFDDFTLRVQARQTGREYAHRDLVVVFGYRDPEHFLYAHLASQGDANAHHIMLVDGAPRRPVTVERSSGVAWGDGWHELEVTRVGELVEVRFDGGAPVLRATAPPWRGRVGVGSFDDTGRFRALTVSDR